MTATTSVRLIYIAGWMRSGTTILAQVIGSAPNCIAVGELRHTWSILAQNKPCSCGEPARSCPVWGRVAANAIEMAEASYDLPDDPTSLFNELDHRAGRVERFRRIPALVHASFQPRSDWPEDLRLHVTYLEMVTEEVSRACNVRNIVDSSKSPASLLTRGLMCLRSVTTVHIVRDVRGVVNSERNRVAWSAVDPNLSPSRKSTAASSLFWVVTNVACCLVGRRLGDYVRISYERFADEGAPYLRHLDAQLELGLSSDELSRLQIATGHLTSGNPGRFLARQRGISADESWRRELPYFQRWLLAPVNALGKLTAATKRFD